MTSELALRFTLSFLAVQLLGPLLYAWIARERGTADHQADGHPVMRVPGRLRLLLFLLLGFVIVVVGWALISRPVRPAGAMALASITGLLTAVVLTTAAYFDGLAFEIRSEGLLARARWRRPRLLRWEALTTVEFSPLAHAWRLRTPTEAAWVGQGLSNQHLLAGAILQHAPAATIDRSPLTRKLLEDVAAGRGGETFGQ